MGIEVGDKVASINNPKRIGEVVWIQDANKFGRHACLILFPGDQLASSEVLENFTLHEKVKEEWDGAIRGGIALGPEDQAKVAAYQAGLYEKNPGKELVLAWLRRAPCAENNGKHHFRINQNRPGFSCVGCGEIIDIDQAMQLRDLERQYPDLVEVELIRLE